MNIRHPNRAATAEKIGVIDADFHPMPLPTDPQITEHMSSRWVEYLKAYGLGPSTGGMVTPAQRQFTHRLDALDKNGRVGLDPAWAREQVLDMFDMTAAILNCQQAYISNSGMNVPTELAREINKAYNQALMYTWMAADPRYYASIVLSRDLPDIADEIRRCKESEYGNRFVQVLVSPAGQEPFGKQRYWPIFEACAHYDLPLGFHVPGMGNKATAGGSNNFYGEMHMNFASLPMTLLPSLIFEGVFDRFPKLRIVLVELGWSWAPSLIWRLDSVHSKLRSEVSHLERRPSEYMREHVWFTTQPLEEPENLGETNALFTMFEETGLAERLMYSSDYPHWDFDSPFESITQAHPIERRRRILGENAGKLYGIPLLPNSGIYADGQR